jgi:hypothetical protein
VGNDGQEWAIEDRLGVIGTQSAGLERANHLQRLDRARTWLAQRQPVFASPCRWRASAAKLSRQRAAWSEVGKQLRSPISLLDVVSPIPQ